MDDETSNRLSRVTDRDQLSPADRDHFDAIERSRDGVRGPFQLLLHSPTAAGRVGRLGEYLRYESRLTDVDREIAILTTAREFDCAYEWAAHTPIAREVGVQEEVIETVAHRQPVSNLEEPAALIVTYGRELLQERSVSDETYRSVTARYDNAELVDLTTTIGYYSLIACVLNAFEAYPSDDAPQLP